MVVGCEILFVNMTCVYTVDKNGFYLPVAQSTPPQRSNPGSASIIAHFTGLIVFKYSCVVAL